MKWVETKGTWREVGRQYGEQCREELRRCLDRYAGRFLQDLDRYAPAIARIRASVERSYPPLLEETAGMAEGSGLEEPALFVYRFFNEVKDRMKVGCSAIFMADAAEGPLMARNCDLEPDTDPDLQVCCVCRPKDGVAAATVGYLGVASGVGINAHGLALASASAHTDARYGNDGVSGNVYNRIILDTCRSVADVCGFAKDNVFFGKPAINLVAEPSGASAIMEKAPGRNPVMTLRPAGCTWQACTNFFQSGEIPIKQETWYLASAYARYGRVAHQLLGDLAPRTFDGMKQLIIDIAQPGVCIIENEKMRTAYSHLMDLRARTMHVAPGHPAEVEWRTVTL